MKKLVSAELEMRDLSADAREYYNGTDARVYKDILNDDAYYVGYNPANADGPYTFAALDEMFCEIANAAWWDLEDSDDEE